MLSTDGAPVFKSVHMSIWPLYASVLEIPIERRFTSKNILLLGLWYGGQKPDPNIYLKETLSAISRIEEQGGLVCQGKDNNTFTVGVHIHSLICDLPAKSLVLHHKLYNGKFGCQDCFHPGKRLPVRGNVRTYPYKVQKYPMRTAKQTRGFAQLAEVGKLDIFGIKGMSILHDHMLIPDGSPVDYMHCILQGTGKWVIKALIDSKKHADPFYITPEQQKIFNARLVSISVPHDMPRKPRSLEYIKYWKATEIQHFLLYYGLPVLKGILEPQYFHHFALLFTGLWIMLKTVITPQEGTFAGYAFDSFSRLMHELYGERSETINVHNLIHLEKQVQRLGPLWTHSAFGFEAMIADTLKGFKGTRGVPEQIVTNYLIDKEIYPLKLRMEISDTSLDVKQLSKCFALSKHRSNWVQVSETVYFSVPTMRSMTDEEQEVLRPLGADNNVEYSFAEKMLKHGTEYHSKAYKRAGKSCSNIIQFQSYAHGQEAEYHYGEVQEYVSVGVHNLAVVKVFPILQTTICKINILPPTDAVVLGYVKSGLLGSNHIPVSGPPEPELQAVDCVNVSAKCIIVKSDEPIIYAYVTPISDINVK